MNYFLLAETDFFRLINEAGDCNMETAYTAFATQVIELCNGGMDMNHFLLIWFDKTKPVIKLLRLGSHSELY